MLFESNFGLFIFSGVFFEVQLPSPLAGGSKLQLQVETVLSHVLRPFPLHITQAERQLVVFQANHYLYSPYPTTTQTTRVRLASKNVESYTKLGNPTKSDENIEYGPFHDVPPYSQVTFQWLVMFEARIYYGTWAALLDMLCENNQCMKLNVSFRSIKMAAVELKDVLGAFYSKHGFTF